MLNSIILTTLKEGSKKRNSKINPLNVAASTSSEQTQQNLTDTEIVNLNERQSNRTTIRIKKKRRTIIGGAIGGVDIEEDDIEDIEDEEEEEDDNDEVIKKQDSSSLNNDDTDRDEDLELVQDEDDEAKNDEIIENVVEEASVSDLVVENEPEKKGEENSYKLFKIILEQTDPVVWDNQENNNNNIVNSSQVDDQVKLTISSQIPIALNTNPNENKSKQSNLTVCQSDFWSNTAVVVEEEAAKMSSTDSEDLIKLSTDSEKSSDVVDVLNPSSQPGKKKKKLLYKENSKYRKSVR